MSSKKLFMNDNPLLNTFNTYASVLSIISRDNTNISPWLYNNFIQIRYVHDWNTYFFDNHHHIFDNCPWINHHVIPGTIIKNKWTSLHEFIIDAINESRYVYLYVDRYYIPASKAYQKNHNWHEIFIFGYDLEKSTFHVADNIQEGKYIHTECTFSELDEGYNALNSDNEFFQNVHLLSIKEEHEYKFNLQQIALTLENYVYSKPTIDMSFKEESTFGIGALNLTIEAAVNYDQCSFRFDKRAFHLFWEHKKMMILRLEYMYQSSLIPNGLELINNYKELESSYLMLRNLVIKYNITNKNTLRQQIIEIFKSNINKEKEVIYNILCEIQ
ncbi:hypothetical protein MKX75_21770 [Paenibacillus sp. FSL R5-0341]|uniref:hypothetical protein n=1 Tax=Paenibacillus sp. FSL R5-0341 TaxID=2921636 RepID=UPI0030D15B9C